MGVKVYQRGKGSPKQTSVEKENNIYLSDTKKDEKWVRFAGKGDVGRYNFTTKEFIKYGDNLAEPRDKDIFEKPKIFMSEVFSPTIKAQYVSETAIAKNTYAVINQKLNDYDLFYLLGILNSNFILKYALETSSKGENVNSPSFISSEIKNIPIPIGNKKAQSLIATKVKLLLDAYDEVLDNEIDALVTSLFEGN